MYHFKRTEMGNDTCVKNLSRSPVDYAFKDGSLGLDPHYKAYPHAWALPLEYGPDMYPDIRRAENGQLFTNTQGRIVKDLMNDHKNRHNVLYNGNVSMYNFMRNLHSPLMGQGQQYTEQYIANGY